MNGMTTVEERVTITLNGQTYPDLEVNFAPYAEREGGVAIQLWDTVGEEGWGPEPIATATVNLQAYNESPADGCVFIKDYSENSGMLASLIATGKVRETGRFVQASWSMVPEVELLDDWLEAAQIAESSRDGFIA